MQKLPIIIKVLFIVLPIIAGVLLVLLFVTGNTSIPGFKRSPTAPTGVPGVSGRYGITEILPKNTTQTFFPIQEITLVFNSSTPPDNVQYTVNPSVQTRTRQGAAENIVIISPETVWQPGQTTVTIQANTTSRSGTTLGKPTTYTFKSNFPENPVEEQEGANGYPPQEVIEKMKQQYSNQ